MHFTCLNQHVNIVIVSMPAWIFGTASQSWLIVYYKFSNVFILKCIWEMWFWFIQINWNAGLCINVNIQYILYLPWWWHMHACLRFREKKVLKASCSLHSFHFPHNSTSTINISPNWFPPSFFHSPLSLSSSISFFISISFSNLLAPPVFLIYPLTNTISSSLSTPCFQSLRLKVLELDAMKQDLSAC